MLSDSKIIAFVLTTDAGLARAFYETKLGLRFVTDDGFALVFDANGTMLRIVKSGPFSPMPATVLGWEVKQIETIMARLIDAGVTFEKYSFAQQDEQGIWNAPGGARVAWFKDPDGNVLSLSEHAG